MKKILKLFILITLVFSLCACGDNQTSINYILTKTY